MANKHFHRFDFRINSMLTSKACSKLGPYSSIRVSISRRRYRSAEWAGSLDLLPIRGMDFDDLVKNWASTWMMQPTMIISKNEPNLGLISSRAFIARRTMLDLRFAKLLTTITSSSSSFGELLATIEIAEIKRTVWSTKIKWEPEILELPTKPKSSTIDSEPIMEAERKLPISSTKSTSTVRVIEIEIERSTLMISRVGQVVR